MRKNLFLLVLAFLCLIVPNALAQDKTFDLVVAQDGSGNFLWRCWIIRNGTISL